MLFYNKKNHILLLLFFEKIHFFWKQVFGLKLFFLETYKNSLILNSYKYKNN